VNPHSSSFKKLNVLMGMGALVALIFFAQTQAQTYQEAPMLAERTASGELPPVAERLPANPRVIEPVEQIGQYGGTARALHIQTQYYEDAVNLMGKEAILWFNRDDGRTVEPNLAESWELAEDARSLTFKLREGMKWSDGQPFTADDFVFYYEDVLLNKELTPVPPRVWSPGDELMKVVKLDDYTVRLEFAEPYAAAEIALAVNGEVDGLFLPKHYMQQFHPNYVAEDELAEKTRQAGFSEWYELFGAKRTLGSFSGLQNPEGPVLHAFKIVRSDQQRTVLERNPYYWKVDPEGNQLPYIDRINLDLIQNTEVYTLQAISGDVTLAQWNATVDNASVYIDNAEQNDYRVLRYDLSWPSMVQYYFNMNHQNPAKREVFGDKRFRVAMSLAINRDEINEALFLGLGEAMQTVVLPKGGRFWDEELAKMYTEYDPDEANRLLDEMGLEYDGEYRTLPNGEPLAVNILFWPGEGGDAKIRTTDLVQQYWQAVGVRTTVRQLERDYLYTLREAGNFDVTLWHTGAMSDPVWILNPWHTVPMIMESSFAPEWARWYLTRGEQGEEPPEEAKRTFELWEQMKSTSDEAELVAAAKEIQRIHVENAWSISTVGLVLAPVIVSNDLRNIPETGQMAYDWVYFARYNPEQFYLTQP
jgi:peptide/nickel transport system substrate-binding protein